MRATIPGHGFRIGAGGYAQPVENGSTRGEFALQRDPHDALVWSVRASGDLDIASAPALETALDELISSGARVISVDLDGIVFMDSSGLRVLLSAAQRMADQDSQLFIEGASGAVQRILEVTGVIERLRQRADS
jgi:anti-anti-sigma factor